MFKYVCNIFMMQNRQADIFFLNIQEIEIEVKLN
jgi:hypothetical protein